MTLLTSTTPAAAQPVNTAPPAAGADPVAAAPDAVTLAGAVTGAALPLFAQLLTLPDAGTAPAANSDTPPAVDDEGAPAAPVADATSAMASMAATMLAVTLPQPSQAGAGATGGDGQARVDALNGGISLNTSAALHGAGARLDLSTAGVAVTAAPAPGATPPAAVPAASSAAAGAALTAATQASLPVPASQQTPASGTGDDAGQAQAQASGRTAADAALARAGQAGQAAPALPPQATPWPPSAAPARSTDSRRSDASPTDGAVRTALAGAGKDDLIPAVSRSDATPAAVNGSYAPAAPAAPASDSVKLAGTPEQWQQPLREALGDRLQLQLQRNDEHAVIRLEPPNMGRVEISIRHLGGALQVNLSANNSEVLRQLNSIGDSVRQDLSQRQFSDVAVTVSAAPRAMLAGGDGRGREQQDQQGQQEAARTPGRALSDDSDAAATFAMSTERE
ncbi:MAG: flagellar hook-length control protein FliK [Pseudomonadota bacterium]